MGCCLDKETFIVKPLMFRTLTTEETTSLVYSRARCFLCDELLPHPYVLMTECTGCNRLGHTQCISKWHSEHKNCPLSKIQ